MRIRTAPLQAVLIAGLLATGCSTTRRLEEGRYLLKKNRIEAGRSQVDPGALEAIVKQKPNKKILGFPFYLHVYNLPDPEKIPLWKERKNARRDRKNAERVERGDDPKPYRPTRAEWLRDVVGEPPVVVDTALTRRSREQIRLFMQKEGYFRATVSDTTHHHRKRIIGGGRGKPFGKPKVEVEYQVKPGGPYRLRRIERVVDDPLLNAYMMMDTVNSLLRAGDRFRADLLDQERTRMTDHFKELGYLYFHRDLIFYDLDTTVGGRQADLTLRIERPLSGHARDLMGTREGSIIHLEDVSINMSRRQALAPGIQPDTIQVDGYRFLYTGRRPEFKPKALICGLSLRPSERYRKSNVDRTYLRLTNLRVFDRVDIIFDTLAGDTDRVNARIELTPSKRQSVAVEPYFTNRGGALGTQASVSYRHRNLFRSMGSIQASFTLGLEAQRSITGTDEGSDAVTTIGQDVLFNTVELGPEVTVRFPQFLIPFMPCGRFARSAAPRTLFSLSYNYQRRPDYTRTVARFSLGYEWNESRFITWGIFPAELNVVRIPQMDPEFAQYIKESNDPVLSDSYTDHIILSIPRVVHTLNTQARTGTRDHFFNRSSVEWAGSVLRWINEQANKEMTTDSAGNRYFEMLGVRYAEFIKVEDDFRFYHTIHSKSSMAFRVSGGLGVPYGNLDVLPFETSFYVGGANGLRAWRARSVGPGSYSAPLQAYDRTGEVRLEANAEYRFKLIGFIEGALFADLGNIWLLKEDTIRPGSGFAGDFYDELAVGIGAGLRLNFDFFLIRFDFGLQTKDPGLPKGERWIFQQKDQYEQQFEEAYGYDPNYKPQVNFNLGIGYPF